MSSDYRCTLFLPGGMAKIEYGQVEIVLHGRKLSSHELAAIATINEMVERLKNGHFTSYEADLKSFENPNEIMKCEWLRSGNLKVHGPTNSSYRFVITVPMAIAEKRTFTCYRAMLAELPKARQITKLTNSGGSVCTSQETASSNHVPVD